MMFNMANQRWLIGFEEAKQWALQVSRAPDRTEAHVIAAPDRLSEDHQWSRLEEHLLVEIQRTQSVLQLQDTAEQHVHAAHYALDRIAIELVDVMPDITQVAEVHRQKLKSMAGHQDDRSGEVRRRPSLVAA